MRTFIGRRFVALVAVCTLVVLALAGGAVRAAPAAQSPMVINMKSFQFQPKSLTVPVGTKIVWTNGDQAEHTAQADDGSFDTGDVEGGATSKEITFDKPGTYAYFCKYHGGPGGKGMSGTIVVEAAQASPPASASPSASASAEPSASASAEPSASASPAASTSAGPTPSLKVSNQAIVNGAITVAQVVAAEDGWVAIHRFGPDGKMMLTPLAGLAPVKAGTTTNLRIKLDASFKAGDKLAPMLHVDGGQKGTYEFPNGPDTPVQANGQAVVQTITVQAGAAGGPSTLPNTGATGTNSVAIVTLGVIGLLAGLWISRSARRRNNGVR